MTGVQNVRADETVHRTILSGGGKAEACVGLVEWIHSGKRCRHCLELRPDAQVSEGQQRALFYDDGAKLHGTARCSS